MRDQVWVPVSIIESARIQSERMFKAGNKRQRAYVRSVVGRKLASSVIARKNRVRCRKDGKYGVDTRRDVQATASSDDLYTLTPDDA